MKATNFELIKYEADEGMVFDWKEPRYTTIFDDEGNAVEQIQEHLNAKVLFIGINDNIDNYIEVEV